MQPISDELRRFVRAHFRSILQLETLLVLARSPDRWWTAEELNLELRSSVQTTATQLEHLSTSGLAEAESGSGRFRYRPQSDATQSLVDNLISLHKLRFHALVELIYRSKAQEFADAFKLKKAKEEE
jgi:hypothetical protein